MGRIFLYTSSFLFLHVNITHFKTIGFFFKHFILNTISFLYFRNKIPSGKLDIFAAQNHFFDKGNSPRKVIFRI